jgi:hypothetical protein
MSPRLASRFAWGSWFLLFALSGLYLGLVILNRDAPVREHFADRVFLAVAILAMATCAALVVKYQPRNAIGWLLLAAGFGLAAAVIGFEYAIRALVTHPDTMPGGVFAAWLYSWCWVPLLLVIAPGMVLFPDGRLPSQRWRPIVWLSLFLQVVLLLGAATNPRLTLDGSVDIANPLEIDWGPDTASPGFVAFSGAGLLVLLANATAPVLRFRRAGGVERQQLKWVMFAGLLFVVTLAIIWPLDSATGFFRDAVSLVYTVAILGIPVSITLAILRYGLYDIDRILNRTLVYGFLTAALAAVYFGLVVGLQALLRPVNGGSDLAIALTTLAVAALFLPARKAVQDAVDRRFNRRTYDSARTIAAFSVRLRQQIDLDTLHDELLSVVDETMQPSAVGLWLRAASSVTRRT